MMKKFLKLFAKTGHVFFKVGTFFVKLLGVIPGFKLLSVRNQQISALIVLIFIVCGIAYFMYPYISHRYILSALEAPADLNLSEYQKNSVLVAINDVYGFEGNNDQAVIGKITNETRIKSRFPNLRNVRNGEYLLIMPDMVVVYDFENRQIMDISRTNMLDLKSGDDE